MKKCFTLVYFLLTAGASFAQNNGAVLIPRAVYVGDPAALILSLPGTPVDMGDIIITPPRRAETDIDIHRIALERRITGSRLVIEFTAFKPGIIELPDLEINGEIFSGISVTVNSIIQTGASAPELSRPASSLAMPGTALLLYSSMIIIILLLLLSIWFVLKGRAFMRKFIARWKLWRLFVSIKNTEKHLYRSLLRGENKRDILDVLSEEFRTFLSFFTGFNCRAMTAREFEKLPDMDSNFLGDFFQHCDQLRFSGEEINSDEIMRLLDNLRFFLGQIEKTKNEKEIPNTEMAA